MGKRTQRKLDTAPHADSHWLDGGTTDLDNLVLLCRKHHRLIHHSEWHVHIVNGRPEFTPPTWLKFPQQE